MFLSFKIFFEYNFETKITAFLQNYYRKDFLIFKYSAVWLPGDNEDNEETTVASETTLD